jgi:hypothetical protein
MESSTNLKGAVVEIVEPGGVHNGPVIPTRVRVNGVDVGLIVDGGVVIDPGHAPDQPTTVTLKLLPASVVIHSTD